MTAEDYLNNELGDTHQTYDDVGVTILSGIEHSEMCRILDEYHEHKLKLLGICSVINWVAVRDSLPDHLEKVIMYGKRTEHNEPEIITGVLNKAGGLNDWNTYGIVMDEVTHWAKIKPPCL